MTYVVLQVICKERKGLEINTHFMEWEETSLVLRPTQKIGKGPGQVTLAKIICAVSAVCHAKSGPGQKWSPRPPLVAKNSPPPPDQFYVKVVDSFQDHLKMGTRLADFS